MLLGRDARKFIALRRMKMLRQHEGLHKEGKKEENLEQTRSDSN